MVLVQLQQAGLWFGQEGTVEFRDKALQSGALEWPSCSVSRLSR